MINLCFITVLFSNAYKYSYFCGVLLNKCLPIILYIITFAFICYKTYKIIAILFAQ